MEVLRFHYLSFILDMAAKFKKFKVYILFFGLLGSACELVGQTRFSVGVSAGYSGFAMKSLSDYQRERLKQFDVPVKITDDFPAYLNLGLSFMISRPKVFYVFYLGHTSTGGRIHYEDYSGYVSSEMVPKMTYLGAGIAGQIFKIKTTHVFLGANLLEYSNKLKMTDEEVIHNIDHNYKGSVTLESVNVAIGPLLEAQREVKKFLFKVNASYEFHLQGKLMYGGQADVTLKNEAGKSVKIDGTGLRINAGVGYLLR